MSELSLFQFAANHLGPLAGDQELLRLIDHEADSAMPQPDQMIDHLVDGDRVIEGKTSPGETGGAGPDHQMVVARAIQAGPQLQRELGGETRHENPFLAGLVPDGGEDILHVFPLVKVVNVQHQIPAPAGHRDGLDRDIRQGLMGDRDDEAHIADGDGTLGEEAAARRRFQIALGDEIPERPPDGSLRNLQLANQFALGIEALIVLKIGQDSRPEDLANFGVEGMLQLLGCQSERDAPLRCG